MKLPKDVVKFLKDKVDCKWSGFYTHELGGYRFSGLDDYKPIESLEDVLDAIYDKAYIEGYRKGEFKTKIELDEKTAVLDEISCLIHNMEN